MDAGRALRRTRAEAGLSQRALARAAGVPQPTVARIESGAVVPRVDTLDRLLACCGSELTTTRRAGAGIDRTQIVAMLQLSPRARLDVLTRDARNVEHLLAIARRR